MIVVSGAVFEAISKDNGVVEFARHYLNLNSIVKVVGYDGLGVGPGIIMLLPFGGIFVTRKVVFLTWLQIVDRFLAAVIPSVYVRTYVKIKLCDVTVRS